MEEYDCYGGEERSEDTRGMTKSEEKYFELCGRLGKREKSIESQLAELGALKESYDSDEEGFEIKHDDNDHRNYYDGGSPSEEEDRPTEEL